MQIASEMLSVNFEPFFLKLLESSIDGTGGENWKFNRCLSRRNFSFGKGLKAKKPSWLAINQNFPIHKNEPQTWLSFHVPTFIILKSEIQ